MRTTQVQRFYAGKTVLVTGGTGFLGNYLIEKLLRSCADIKKIYLLIRAKKGKTPEERLTGFLNNSVHKRLKQENPRVLEKLDVVTGDLELPKLGLGDRDWATIVEEVNCVFHVGATVKFTEELRRAILINVGGTDSVVELAKTMKHLQSFVHVSTAFSQCLREVTEETFYPTDEDGERLLEMARSLDRETMNDLSEAILDKWPNSYVFTKHIAEDLIKRKADCLPIAVVRPSIVMSPYDVPVTCWASTFDPNSLLMGAINMGLSHSLRCDPKHVVEFIPVDLVVNHAIVIGWSVGIRGAQGPIPIYNCVSGQQNPITWGLQDEHRQKSEWVLPSSKKIFHSFMVYTTNRFVLQLVDLVYLPLIHVINSISLLRGETHIILIMYRKMKEFSKVVEFVTCRQWNFKDDNTRALWNSLDEDDRCLFNFDVKSIDWIVFSVQAVAGARINVLQDDLSSLSKAKRKSHLLKVFHYLLLVIYLSLFVFILYKSFYVCKSILSK
ncbi:hypothetical protein PPYR_03001 [Photinus pyralis]|uniref:Fatty acyl-CoA reductase n=3 Tax=Photinus pyralis TaxID=7054 RepID=A0A5N4A1N0_PHOPY|nr:fatty acyl-CoA reductase wat-like [Photinus pyralis]XP_031331188.1 fatty acyl-CoA reductase wat-like [Photinus pyralis]XP_031331189.1 fatty acyl-CoA reductase wat-like [Photinus pyralis]KAB0791201.1 hypothetical protein PPYR_03001 [Photinus pyralis]